MSEQYCGFEDRCIDKDGGRIGLTTLLTAKFVKSAVVAPSLLWPIWLKQL